MLDEALRVFAREGYHGASMAEIAAGVGVTKPMVYAYFGSKDELYLRCIDRATERLLEAFTIPAEEGEAPDHTLWRRALAYFEFLRDNRDEWMVMRRQAAAAGGPFSERVAEGRKRVIRSVAEQIRETVGGDLSVDDLEPVATGIVGVGESLGDWWVDHPDETPEAMAAREINLVWVGLGGLIRGEYWAPPAG
jgi:AcrR family transcriptional regulator